MNSKRFPSDADDARLALRSIGWMSSKRFPADADDARHAVR